MRLTKIFIGAVGLMTFLSACAADFPLSEFPKSFTVLSYESGKVTEKSSIKVGDDLYQSLYDIIDKNSRGWSKDINTYAPKVYFRSQKMTITCNNDTVAVNYMNSDGNWVQLSKHGIDCVGLIKAHIEKL